MRIPAKPVRPDATELLGGKGIDRLMQPSPQLHPPRLPVPVPKDDQAFDRWLKWELGRLHNDVLREPIPDRLLAIIEGATGKN